jgi:hypothetical protein
MSEEQVFPVRRRLVLWIAWLFLVMTPLSIAISIAEGPPFERKILFVSIIGLTTGVLSLKAVRNVREIRIDAERLLFLPVGAE